MATQTTDSDLSGGRRAVRCDGISGNTAWTSDLPASRRRYRRWDTVVPVTVEIDRTSHYATVTDISPEDAALRLVTPCPVTGNTPVVVYIKGYGEVPGRVRRCIHEILGVEFQLDAAAQAGLSDWLAMSNIRRRRPRQGCNIEATALVADGELPCLVCNRSESGAAIEVADPARISVGRELVLLLPERPPVTTSVRHLSDGKAGLSFLESFEASPSR